MKLVCWQLQITSRIRSWKKTKIGFTCKSKQLEDKTIDGDEFKERTRKDKEKQSKYYDQHKGNELFLSIKIFITMYKQTIYSQQKLIKII